MLKFFIFALGLFLLIGCESKEEMEIRKKIRLYNRQITRMYEDNKNEEALKIVIEFEEKYPNVKKTEEVENINRIKSEIMVKLKKEEEKNKQKQLIKNELYELVKDFDMYYDEFQNITWVSPKNHVDNMYVYGGFEGKTYVPSMFYRLVIKYSNKNWIFFTKVIMLTDFGKYEIDLDRLNQKTDVKGGYVYEKYDIFLNDYYENIVRAIANSDTIKVRLEGKEGVYDFKLSDSEISNFKNMMNVIEKEKEYKANDEI